MKGVYNYHGEWFYEDETPTRFKLVLRYTRNWLRNIFAQDK